MNIMTLLNAKVGKRMTAFIGGAYLIGEADTQEAKIMITAMAVFYMVCQTISDWKKEKTP